MFDFRDGVAWNTSTNAPCGGPGNPPCPGGPGMVQAWNRDAVLYERPGFDCSKGHPAGTNYHHHQNPSAFDLDLNVISTICNLYDGDGLYAINTAQHSPLIGFAFPLIGLFIAPIYPLLNSIVLSALPKNLQSSMTGLIVIFSALGGTLGSRITRWLFKNEGPEKAFYFTLIPMSLLLISFFILKKITAKDEI